MHFCVDVQNSLLKNLGDRCFKFWIFQSWVLVEYVLYFKVTPVGYRIIYPQIFHNIYAMKCMAVHTKWDKLKKKCSHHFRWGFCCLMSLLPNLQRNKLNKLNIFLWIFELQTRALGSHIFFIQNFLLISVDSFLFFNTMLLGYSLMYSIFCF